MHQHSHSDPEPSAPQGHASVTTDSAKRLESQLLESQLWLERCCNQLSQLLSSRLLELLSRDTTPLGQHGAIEAEVFQIIVNELSAALGNRIVAIALPWREPDSDCGLISPSASPSDSVFKVCHVAPLRSRRSSQPPDLIEEIQMRLNLGETLFTQDLQQWQNLDWQTAWTIENNHELVGWLIVAPAAQPEDQLLRQSRAELVARTVQQGAIAIRQIHLLQSECSQCRKLEARIRELERANQLKSEFLASTSHEIRTPLNSMLGFVQLLQNQSRSTDLAHPDLVHQDYLDIILSSGQHLLALINDILDLSKVEADRLELQWETVHVPNLCHNLLTLVAENAHAKGLQLRLDLDPSVTTFVTDPLRLKQMLFNLLSNAVKFTVTGTVGLRVNLVGVFLHFTVWDTGTGMRKDQQARLFRPYTQFPNEVASHEGTGLGLAVSQKLAKLHGGWIEVHSEINRGSQFTLALPLTPAVGDRDAPPAIPPLPPPAPFPRPSLAAGRSTYRPSAATGSSERVHPPVLSKPILVVEDNASNARLVLTYLTKLGYQVLWAKNPAELWVCLKNTLPALILMDIGLPDVDGITLIKQLRATTKYKSIPVVVQTAMAMAGDRELCLEAGAVAYIPKPVALDVLAHLVADYSDRR